MSDEEKCELFELPQSRMDGLIYCENRLRVLEARCDKYEEWLMKEILAHADGTMMSMSEAIHGEIFYNTALKEFNSITKV